MSLTQLWWGDLENLVPDIIKADYLRLSELEKRKYLRDLKEADAWRLENYGGRRKGKAYALWHHLLRMENIASAVLALQETLKKDEQYKRLRIKPKMRILDVGSATGNGVMALTFVYAKARTSGAMDFHFTLIEPFLSNTGDRILEQYFDVFREKSDADAQFTWEYWEGVKNFQLCASAENEGMFDLILFSHTFNKERPDDWQLLQEHIKKIVENHLAPDGIMLLLTPQQPTEKIIQVKSLVATLKQDGFDHLNIEITKQDYEQTYNLFQNRAYSSPDHSQGYGQRHPTSLVEMREWFVQEGNRLGVSDVFDLNPKNGIPYYSFTCRVDCILKPLDKTDEVDDPK